MVSGIRDKATIQQMKKQVEQLRRELNVKRVPLSHSAKDLVNFVQNYQREDVLVVGFTNQRDNPFRPKSSFQCSLL